MKNKKCLFLVIVVCVIACVAVVFNFPKQKDEKMIKEFLDVALTKSEENIKLNELLIESSAIIGEGVDEKTQKDSLKRTEKAQEEFVKVYEKYLDAHGLEVFQEKMFSYISDIHATCGKCEILDTKIEKEKDNDYYKFQVTLDVDGSEQKLEGRAELTDGKINTLVLTTF